MRMNIGETGYEYVAAEFMGFSCLIAPGGLGCGQQVDNPAVVDGNGMIFHHDVIRLYRYDPARGNQRVNVDG